MSSFLGIFFLGFPPMVPPMMFPPRQVFPPMFAPGYAMPGMPAAMPMMSAEVLFFVFFNIH